MPAFKQPLSPKKKPLMPPTRREQKATANSVSQQRTSSGGDDGRPTSRQSRDTDGGKRSSQSALLDTAKARAEFTRLVMEQHEHVNDQNMTLKTLDEEFDKFQAMAQRREQSETLIQVSWNALVGEGYYRIAFFIQLQLFYLRPEIRFNLVLSSFDIQKSFV